MKVSTKGRYALRIMIDLAQHNDGEAISLKDIARRQEVSAKYLELIIAILNKAGFVHSTRGKAGGYRLANAPSEYTVGEILKAADGGLAPVNCRECSDGDCPRANQCATLPLWQRLDHLVENFLQSVTLQDMLDGTLPPV